MNIIYWMDDNGFTHTMRCPDGHECTQAHIDDLEAEGIDDWWVEPCA